MWLDDVGRGDSALARLVDLPLDGVEIDRGSTERMLTDRTTRSIVEAISRLAFVRDLGTPERRATCSPAPSPPPRCSTWSSRTAPEPRSEPSRSLRQGWEGLGQSSPSSKAVSSS